MKLPEIQMLKHALGVGFILGTSIVQHSTDPGFEANAIAQIRNNNSNTRVQVVGEFLNVKRDRRSGDAHGYSLQLWKSGDQLFGLIAAYAGSDADPPTGLLKDVRFNSASRELSFKTDLSTSIVFDSSHRAIRSKDTLEFKGTLTRQLVQGKLRILSQPGNTSSIKRVRLNRSNRLSQDMTAPLTYDEWKIWADTILVRLGPK